MTKVYSKKFNAQRAASKAGLAKDAFEIVSVDGGFTFRPIEKPTTTPALASDHRAEVIDRLFARWLAADARGEEFIRQLLGDAFDANSGRTKRAKPERAARTGEPGGKRKIVVSLLTRPEGATARELLDATGWKALSIPATAKAAGLNLRQEKDGKVTRYYGKAA